MKVINILLASSMLVSASQAWAQSTPADAASADEDAGGLVDIVVTARRIEEKLQDVPLTIKALSGDDIEERGIQSVSELSQFTPGLSYSPDFGRVSERPVIRGISALRPEAPQPVSVFINGVFLRDGALGLVLEDAQRVEIIKGPQSALYGRSTYAGAINYISKKPGDKIEGFVRATLAGSGERRLSAAITLPLIKDILSVRLRGRHYEFGGQYTNSLTGNKIGQEQTKSLGYELSFTPSDAFDALVTFDYSKDNDGFFPAVVRTVPILAGGVVVNQNGSTNIANGQVCNGRTLNIVGTATAIANGWPCGPSNFTGRTVRRNEADFANYVDPNTGVSYGNIAGLNRRMLRSTVGLNYNFGGGYKLSSLTGITRQYTHVGADQSYNATRFSIFGTPWTTYDRDNLQYWSQEVRLASPQDQAFTWLVGGFYYKENGRGITSDVITTTGRAPLRAKSGSSVENIAAFGRLQYEFGDRFKVSAEGRYGEETVRVIGTPLGVARVTGGTCVAGQQCVVDGSRKFSDFAPRFTADFKPVENVLIYAQAAKGVKSGGFNTTPGLAANVFTFEGETVWSYEIGLKSDFWNRKARFNLALFQNDVSQLQLSNLVTNTNPITGAVATTTIVNNVGTARSKGFEAELIVRPVDWLTLSGNYAYTDAKALVGTESSNASAFGGNASVAGFTLPRTPKHSAAGSAELEFPVGSGDLKVFARGDILYQSRRFAEIQNLIWAAAFTRINASIGIRSDIWTATLFVKNASNNDSSLNGFRYVDPGNFRRSAVDFLPRLRQYGATFAVNF